MRNYCLAYLRNKGIPLTVATLAADAVLPTVSHMSILDNLAPLNALLDSFVTLYELEGSAEAALEIFAQYLV